LFLNIMNAQKKLPKENVIKGHNVEHNEHLKIKGQVNSFDELKPIANARVISYDKSDKELASTYADTSGFYELVIKGNEDFKVLASKENFYSDSIFISRSHDIENNEIIRNFYLKSERVQLLVLVYDQIRRDYLNNVTVDLFDENGEIIGGITNNEGNEFWFDLKINETYELKAFKEGYYQNNTQKFVANSGENGQLVMEIYLSQISLQTWRLPEFPWPPPLPSAKIEIPTLAFSSCKNLSDVNDILSNALSENGYDDKAYFLVPASSKNGFALATQLEQIDKDGVPKKDPNRWNSEIIDNEFSFSEYISALFFPNPGYFRIIVFIVTDISFSPSSKGVDRESAMSWLYEGATGFPDDLKSVLFTKGYNVSALIYEYELKENEEEANMLKPSKHTGKDHLKRSNLWAELIKKK